MLIAEIISHLQSIAPLSLQESYDNAGLLTGLPDWNSTGVLCTLDVTEDVISEAVTQGCNLIVTHHPVIFSPLKKLNGATQVEKTVIAAIKNNIGIYAMHTNLDNVLEGVNKKVADRLQLSDRRILLLKTGTLQKLYTYVPHAHLENVRTALFQAGAGKIGRYNECSFSSEGSGTFKPGAGTTPFVGAEGIRHMEQEAKLEIVFPGYLKSTILSSLMDAHPYEEVAYEVIDLNNNHPEIGSGIIGKLPFPLPPHNFLSLLKESFGSGVIRYTSVINKEISKVALCGGSGGFLIKYARDAGADAFVSADIRYHDFFETSPEMMICDIGHYESEQYTIDLIAELLKEKFPTFAILKSGVNTNPVQYYT